MDKVWFIQIDNRQEGPYSFKELLKDERITPDTLVWKRGFVSWVAARYVLELKDLFKDKKESASEGSEFTEKWKKKLPENEVLAIQTSPPNLKIWILIVLLILAYIFYRIFAG